MATFTLPIPIELDTEGTLMVTEQPGPCTLCGVSQLLFVNRNGRTICAECARQPRT
jgi:hypothetical protein